MTDAVWTERVWRQAESRLEKMNRDFRRQVFGDEHYLEELKEDDRINRQMRHEEPPKTPSKLPGWKRHLRFLRMRG